MKSYETPNYRTRTFNPSHGGHAPGHLRGALYEWIEDRSLPCVFEVDGEQYDIERLTGALWNCTDVMPSEIRGQFEKPEAFTVAQAARRIRKRGRHALE